MPAKNIYEHHYGYSDGQLTEGDVVEFRSLRRYKIVGLLDGGRLLVSPFDGNRVDSDVSFVTKRSQIQVIEPVWPDPLAPSPRGPTKAAAAASEREEDLGPTLNPDLDPTLNPDPDPDQASEAAELLDLVGELDQVFREIAADWLGSRPARPTPPATPAPKRTKLQLRQTQPDQRLRGKFAGRFGKERPAGIKKLQACVVSLGSETDVFAVSESVKVRGDGRFKFAFELLGSGPDWMITIVANNGESWEELIKLEEIPGYLAKSEKKAKKKKAKK